MKAPATPIDETLRPGTLNGLDILNTPTGERFERLTRMAKRVFGGIVEFNHDKHQLVDELLAAGDALMYAAKQRRQ